MPDLDAMSDTELEALAGDAAAVLQKRREIAAAAARVTVTVSEYASAAGMTVGEAWARLCPLDLAPSHGETVPVDAPEWVQPAGSHDAYEKGAQVVYQGAVYESMLAGNAWSPIAYPQGWRRL